MKKLFKAAGARTPKGRANYLADAVADEALKNPYLDEALHFAIEMALGKGSAEKRFSTWARKAWKHRRRR